MIAPGRYTSGRIAIANLWAAIDTLQLRRVSGPARFGDLALLSDLLFLRGDLLGRICDHDRAELIGLEAVSIDPQEARALYSQGRIAARFHLFAKASDLLLRALAAGHPAGEIDAEMAALLQATGRYGDALALRERQAKSSPSIQSSGALATLLAEMGEWSKAERVYNQALAADFGVSPIPAAQLLFEWGVGAMRRGELDRAGAVFEALNAILPAHVPGRGHQAEVALARGNLLVAEALVMPLVDVSDDPEYRATYAEILSARGDVRAACEATRAAQEYECLLARRPEAYADHAAGFFIGVGDNAERAVELALANWEMRDTPRSRKLLTRARQKVQARSIRWERAA